MKLLGNLSQGINPLQKCLLYRCCILPIVMIQSSKCYTEKELNIQANVKTKNRKNLKVKVLVDSGCTHTRIDKQLVKNKRIQTKLIKFSFEVFNMDGMKNEEITRVAPLEIEINGHKEQLEAVVTDLNGIGMFLGYDWLVKHNPEVN